MTSTSDSASSAGFHLERDSFDRLVLVDGAGERHVGVEPVRAFPISDPEFGLSLVGAQGRELAWVERLSALPAETQQLLREELSSRDFTPQIRRIIHISIGADPSKWTVETDRGPTTFMLKSSEDVRRLDARRAMIIDAHGTRYLISDVGRLDRYSRRNLERYL